MWRYHKPGTYLAFARRAFEVTKAGGTVQLGWAGRQLDLQAFQREFRLALHRRINLKINIFHRGRKHDPQYQVGLMRDRMRIQDYAEKRVVHPCNRLETPELQKRFGWSYGPDGLDIKLFSIGGGRP